VKAKVMRRGTGLYAAGRSATGVMAAPPANVVPSHKVIAERAYAKWVARGCMGGDAVQDWLEAEAELKALLNLRERV
jgi:hypothetical protein